MRETRRQTHKNEAGTSHCGRTMASCPHAAETRRRPTVGCCEVYCHGEIELRPGGRLSMSAFVGNREARFWTSAFTAVPPEWEGGANTKSSAAHCWHCTRDQTRWRIFCILIHLTVVQVCDFFSTKKKEKTWTCLSWRLWSRIMSD